MRIARTLTLAVVMALSAVAGTAGAATLTLQPSALEARTLATSQGGWTSSVSYGGVCAIPGVTCPLGTPSFQATGGAGGAGDGHLRASVTTFASLASNVTVMWASPSFTAPAETDAATLAFSTRPQIASLLGIGAAVHVDAVLADLDVPADSTALASVPLTVASSAFGAQQLTVPPAAVVAGRRYRIELRTVVNAPIALAQSGSVDLDDVSLQLADLIPPSGLTASVPGTGALRVTGQVDPQGQATDVAVEYGPTAAYGSSTTPVSVGGSGSQAYTIPLAGLIAGATYHYRVVASNADGSLATSDATFAVPAAPSDPPPQTPTEPQAPAAPAASPSGSGVPTGAGSAASGGGGRSAAAGGLVLSDPAGFGALLSQCYGAGEVVVVDARPVGRRVMVLGLTRFAAGTEITIVDERGRTVGHAAANARGRFVALVTPPVAGRRPHTLYRALAGASRSEQLRLQRSNTLGAVSVRNRVATIRGRVDVRALGRRVRIAALGGRGAAACRRAGALRRVGRVRVNGRTGAYVLRVRVPNGSGMLALRTRAIGTRVSSSAFVLR